MNAKILKAWLLGKVLIMQIGHWVTWSPGKFIIRTHGSGQSSLFLRQNQHGGHGRLGLDGNVLLAWALGHIPTSREQAEGLEACLTSTGEVGALFPTVTYITAEVSE